MMTIVSHSSVHPAVAIPFTSPVPPIVHAASPSIATYVFNLPECQIDTSICTFDTVITTECTAFPSRNNVIAG